MDLFLTLWGNIDSGSMTGTVLVIIWRVIVVLLGINALIIVHEWGHFIVARLCGVRCDKFYIWFDAYGYKFFSFKWGDTEYGLGWLPLGGYVKMLGQEDNPGGIKAELERARQGVDEKGNPLETPLDETKIAELEQAAYAPDSYLSKNVFQRMAIISAGVIMNVLFAIVCATGAGFFGVQEQSSQIGQVLPGSMAWQNNFQPADKIVAIDGQPITRFQDLSVALMSGQQVRATIERAGMQDPVSIDIMPKLQNGGMYPTIGVQRGSSLKLADIAAPYKLGLSESENAESKKLFGALKGRDLLVRMNDKEVKVFADYERLSREFIDRPIKYTFQRSKSSGGESTFIDVTLTPAKKHVTGLRLTLGELTAIRKGSPAEKAGLIAREVDAKGQIVKKGDVIKAIDNEPILDPLQLPYRLMKRSIKSGSVSSSTIVLTISRDGKELEVPIELDSAGAYTGNLTMNGSMASGELGAAFEILPTVSGAEPYVKTVSGGDRSVIGTRIAGVEMMLTPPGKEATDDVKEVYSALAGLGKKSSEAGGILYEPQEGGVSDNSALLHWFTSYTEYLPVGTIVKFYVKRGEETMIVQSEIRESDEIYMLDRGFYFSPDLVLFKTGSIGQALEWGWDKTVENMGLVFRFLRLLGSTVSPKALGGPVTIVRAAYAMATDPGIFLLFLCMIGANLAVVNFLPIPVLDGGHMVFLFYEMIFRKPPNENIQIILSYFGLFLLLGLMFWVISLDVIRLFTGGLM